MIFQLERMVVNIQVILDTIKTVHLDLADLIWNLDNRVPVTGFGPVSA